MMCVSLCAESPEMILNSNPDYNPNEGDFPHILLTCSYSFIPCHIISSVIIVEEKKNKMYNNEY